MEIIEADWNEYEKLIKQPYHVFGSAAFNKSNEDRCEKAYYLLFKDSKYRLGMIAGVRNNNLHSPYSAPFGGFSFLHDDVRINVMDEALQLISDWAAEKKITSIKITLPPNIYQNSFIAKQVNSLFRNQFIIEKTDLNYAYHLENFDEEYQQSIWYNAKKNLKIALSNELIFSIAESGIEQETAYNIIRQNREARGFPLRMTWPQVQRSLALMPTDFFIVKNKEGMDVAAAVIFHVAKDIAQVIYWGDLPQYAPLKTMNYLSFKVFEYYKAKEIKIVDIGPSTEDSIPNYGLCEFKESIGCKISCKFSFNKNIA